MKNEVVTPVRGIGFAVAASLVRMYILPNALLEESIEYQRKNSKFFLNPLSSLPNSLSSLFLPSLCSTLFLPCCIFLIHVELGKQPLSRPSNDNLVSKLDPSRSSF